MPWWPAAPLPSASASFGVQQHIESDPKGLRYTFADPGLSERAKFVQWVEATIDQTLAASPAKPKSSAPMS
jgi:hypothetical protein